ncbi:MAG TPA: amylo-alpha-1,6-glucosidase [Candidatus Binatia bacterium]|nr:amylo-alpha-1,6-glucosidase [Candidatus Binatia bacterium]
MIAFGREICSRLETAEGREWLVTNGIGGFAMGTVAGLLTRRYHGLLIAALDPPLDRTLLLAKLDEDVKYDGQQYALFVNRWADGALEKDGLRYMERFQLEGSTPVWTFALADALLEKRIWMQRGANTTFVHYRYRRGSGPLELYAKAVVDYRDYHQTTNLNDWQPVIEPLDGEQAMRITTYPEATPLVLRCTPGQVWPDFTWYEDYFLSAEETRGQNDVVEDHLYVGVLGAILQPGETFTIVASSEPAFGATTESPDGETAYRQRVDYERHLLARAAQMGHPVPAQLVLAADQFIVRRATPENKDGRTVIAGYPWFADWGRDTMVSLPGLTLGTGRPQVAARILQTYAAFVDQGMLPNRFPDEGQTPEYNTVDASLWYFEALRAYLEQVSGDESLCRELYSVLRDIVDWYCRGTRYNIHLDPEDGLLYAGEEGVQLTWMDAKVDDWVVTPRIGKAIEVNALWYNALHIMSGLSRDLGYDAGRYEKLAADVRRGFARFWNEQAGYCYDVLDGPEGHSSALRPNQIFAVSLANSPLPARQQERVVEVCARHLLTSFGLRTLAPEAEEYTGSYKGDQKQRDGAYHQGTVWAWLMGPFISAHLRVYGDRGAARAYLAPLIQHLVDHGVGSVSELFDGDPPFSPRGCIAQAWSVAELIRAWQLTA